MTISVERALVQHLKNVLMTDPVLNDYLDSKVKYEDVQDDLKEMFILVRRAHLIILMMAVCGEIGVSQN